MLGRQAARQLGSPQPRRSLELRKLGLPEVPVDAPLQHPHLHDGNLVLRRAWRRHDPLGAVVGSHGARPAQGPHLPCGLVRRLGQYGSGHVVEQLHQQAAQLLRRQPRQRKRAQGGGPADLQRHSDVEEPAAARADELIK